MRAGFEEIEFTPERGLIPGQIFFGKAEGARTPLMAHAAVIESRGVLAVIVSIDILFFSVEFANSLRKRISEKIGAPLDNVMIHTTHTHTGTETDITCWGCEANPDALIPVGNAAVDAVVGAYGHMEDIKIGSARGFDTRFHFCRDWYTKDGRIVTNPFGMAREDMVRPISDIDHSVNVIRFDSVADGRTRCFIVNYANHLDTTAKYDMFGADYAGYLREALRRENGRDVTVLFLNGCCGNINHYDFYNNSHKNTHVRSKVLPSAMIGEGLAQTIREMSPQPVPHEDDIFIQGQYRTFPVPRRYATPDHKAWAERFLAEVDRAKQAGEEYDAHDEMCAEQYLAEDPEKTPKTFELGIHVLQIGDTVYVGLPGEIFSEIGLRIKANSPFANTVVVELTDGTHGYISPDYVMDAGCYESTYSNIAYAGYGAADAIVSGAVEMLREMYDIETKALIGEVKDNRLFRRL